MRSRKLLLGASAIGALAGEAKFFDYTFSRHANDGSEERNRPLALDPADPFNQQKQWYRQVKREQWVQHTPDHLRLVADFIPATAVGHTNKTVILVHGYRQDGDQSGKVAAFFNQRGYNVLMPDNRGHGRSEGDYVTFGWLDRLDYVQWIEMVLARLGSDQTIIMWGVSMGAATVMMTSGETLPPQVKGFIEDCGYTTLAAELRYQIHQRHLPATPLLLGLAPFVQLRIGFNLFSADATKQLANNERPMLFIHGAEDDFIPAIMMDQLIAATKGPAMRLLVPGAGHANAYRTNKALYEATLDRFLDQYIH